MQGPRVITRRLGWHLVPALALLFVLLFVQQGGFHHALEHLGEEPTHPAHTSLCKECLSHASADALALAPPVALPLPLGQQPAPGHQAFSSHERAAAHPYLARAPPVRRPA